MQQTGDIPLSNVTIHFTKFTPRTHWILEALRKSDSVDPKVDFLYDSTKLSSPLWN